MLAITGTDQIPEAEPKGVSRVLVVTVLLLCVVALVAGGVYLFKTHSQPAAAVDTKASEQAVRAADMEWSKAAAAHDLTAVSSFYADDAVVLPANGEMATRRTDMQKAWAPLLTPDVNVAWTPMYVEAAKSGELVYVVGSYTVTPAAVKGKVQVPTDHGKYMSIWKLQDDGRWKAEANVWNSDLAAPAPAAKVARGKKG
jgi:ketosteroid isomerase-like protein